MHSALQQYARYLSVFVAVFAGLLAVVAATNAIVNPTGIYDVVTREGFNRIKPRLDEYSIPWKLARLEALKPDVLFLGNSRTEVGINPQSAIADSVLGKDTTRFNAAIAASTMYGIRRCMQHSAAVGAGQRAVVIGIDYVLFRQLNQTASRQAYARYEPMFAVDTDGNPQPWRRLPLWATTLGSLDAFRASLYTVSHQSQEFDGLSVDGQVINSHLDQRILAKKSPRTSFLREERNWIDTAIKLRNTQGGYAFEDGLRDLALILDEARAHNLHLYLYVTPVHAHLQFLEGEIGEPQRQLAAWKTAVTALVADNNARYPQQPPVEWWDFSIINDVLAEPLPDETHDVLMTWYLDPSHFRDTLGDRVMQVLFTGQSWTTPGGEQFGYRLTPDTVDTVNALHQQKLLAWQQQYPAHYQALQERIRAR